MVGRDVLLRVVKPEAGPGAAVLAVRDLALFSKDLKKTRKGMRRGSGVSTASPSTSAPPRRSSASRRSGNGQTEELIEALAGLAGPGS